MKLIFVIFLLTFFSCQVLSQTNLNWGWGEHNNSLGFEKPSDSIYIKTDTLNIWQIGSPQKDKLFIPFNDYPSLGKLAIVSDTLMPYPINCRSSFQIKLHVSSGCNGYSLSFAQKYDFEQNKDGGIIEVSYDRGLKWYNIINDSIIGENIEYSSNMYSTTDTIQSYFNNPGFTGTQNDIQYVSITFPADDRIVGDTLLIRFLLSSDSTDTGHEGWMLDDFSFGAYLVDGININQINSLNIYPNPAKNEIMINSPNDIKTVEIYSIDGIKVKTLKTKKVVDLSDMNSGIYLLRVDNHKLRKIIVDR